MTGSPWTPPFHWSEENKQRLIELWRSGKSGYEISKMMRITRSAVMGKLNRMGILDGSRSNSPYNNERYRMNAIKKHLAKQKAGDTPNVSKGRVGRRVPVHAPSPPPLPKKRKSSWAGIPGEVDVLRPGECRWPLGEPMETFCKAPVGAYDSYCPYHRTIASSPPGGEPKIWYSDVATHKKYFR